MCSSSMHTWFQSATQRNNITIIFVSETVEVNHIVVVEIVCHSEQVL